MNISEPITTRPPGLAIWQLPFRSFFLAGSLFSSLAVSFWALSLFGLNLLESTSLPPLLWHVHEMIFGFGALIAVGFVLTAVQTWTGQRSITGWPVVALLAIWAVARAMLFWDMGLGISLALLMQMFWWLAVIVIFGFLVMRAKNRRNYVFVPIFVFLASFNLVFLLASVWAEQALALHMGKTAVLLFTLIMGLMGGRVIPFFTVRGANTASSTPIPWLERYLPLVSVMGILVFLTGFFVDLPFTPAVLMITAGLMHLYRLSRWHGLATLGVPLLWSLHLSYLFMGAGLILLGASYLVSWLPFSTALHLITIGAMGLMIFAMMSRVSLGHTGRRLEVSPLVTFSLLLMAFAALTRFFFIFLGYPHLAWLTSAALWSVAGSLFLWVYTPILTQSKLS